MLSFLEKSFPDFAVNRCDDINENQTCYSSEDVNADSDGDHNDKNNKNNNNNNSNDYIHHNTDDISFDDAEYINDVKYSNDDDNNDIKSALPTMQTDFRVR